MAFFRTPTIAKACAAALVAMTGTWLACANTVDHDSDNNALGHGGLGADGFELDTGSPKFDCPTAGPKPP